MADETQRLLVEVVGNDTQLAATLANSTRQINAFAGTAPRAFSALGSAIAGALSVRAVVNFAETSIDEFDKLDRSAYLMSVAFGDAAESVEEWGKAVEKAAGISKSSFQNSAAILRIILENIGFQGKSADNLAMSLSTVAANLSAAFDVDNAQVVEDLTKAMEGQTRAAQKYGILVKDNIVQQWLEEQGWKGTFSALDETTKAYYRYLKILEDTSKVSSFVASNQGDYTIQLNKTKAMIADLEAGFGEGLIPTVNTAMMTFRSMSGTLEQGLAPVLGVINTTIKTLTNTFGGLGQMMGGIGGTSGAFGGSLATSLGLGALLSFGAGGAIMGGIDSMIAKFRIIPDLQAKNALAIKMVKGATVGLNMTIKQYGVWSDEAAEATNTLTQRQITQKAVAQELAAAQNALKTVLMQVGMMALFAAGNMILMSAQDKATAALETTQKQALARAAAQKAIRDGQTKANVDTGNAYDKAADIEAEFNKQMKQLFEDRRKVYLYGDPFAGVTRVTYGMNNLLKGAQAQLTRMRDWTDGMKKLRTRLNDAVGKGIISDEVRDYILKNFQELGPEYTDQILTLTKSSGDDWSTFLGIQKERYDLAGKNAKDDVNDFADQVKLAIENSFGDITVTVPDIEVEIPDSGYDATVAQITKDFEDALAKQMKGYQWASLGLVIGTSVLPAILKAIPWAKIGPAIVALGAVPLSVAGAALGAVLAEGLILVFHDQITEFFQNSTIKIAGVNVKWADALAMALPPVNFFKKQAGDVKLFHDAWTALMDSFKKKSALPFLDFVIAKLEEMSKFFENIAKLLGYKPPPTSGGPGGGHSVDPDAGYYAAGGVVTSPTYGMIGEAGPEAVIPLSQLSSVGGGSGLVINISGNTFGSALTADDVARAMAREVQMQRRTFGYAT
jgi:hypothetical protein